MGRYLGPVCRRCRREGMKLFLKGTRCNMAKCPIETGRPAPGMHGERRGRKLSDYGIQLREKQRLRNQYGIMEEQFKLYFKRAIRQRGITGDILLQLLESRLDNQVYRLGFASSRRSAKQFVSHNHVTVNGRRANKPSIIVKPGSVIQVKDKPKSRELAKKSMETSQGREVPVWFLRDQEGCSGKFIRIPTREEIAPIVNEQLVVELYSK